MPTGPEGLRERINDRLAAVLPGVLATLEAELGLAAGELAQPSVLEPVETRLLAIERFPAILVTLIDAPLVRVEDWGPPLELRIETIARLLAFARGTSYEAAGTARDRYMLAIRRAVLGRRDFAGPDVAVMVETYRESYSEVGNDTSKRSIAAGFAEVRFATHEDVPAV